MVFEGKAKYNQQVGLVHTDSMDMDLARFVCQLGMVVFYHPDGACAIKKMESTLQNRYMACTQCASLTLCSKNTTLAGFDVVI